MNTEISVDSKRVLEIFANLKPKKQTKAFKAALRKGAQILVKETRSQLRKVVGKITTKHKFLRRNGKEGSYSLSQGITYSMKNTGEDEAKVHIMKDFRLKFFEKGTKPRYYTTKNGKKKYIGSIRGEYFFDKAKNLKESEIFSNMNRLLSESILKVAKK